MLLSPEAREIFHQKRIWSGVDSTFAGFRDVLTQKKSVQPSKRIYAFLVGSALVKEWLMPSCY
jgi:hypothetical protein